MSLILVADDDPAILSALSRALRLEGHEVLAVPDGETALTATLERSPDACVLDVSMPVMDGLELTRSLRAAGNQVPILMLTARVEVGDRIAGLDAGADDYLAKPFDLGELLARLRAILRRGTSASKLAAYTITVDTASRRAWRGERQLELTRIEFDLLALLVANADTVLTQSEIYEAVWGYDFGPRSKNLSVHVTYLRSKLEAGNQPRLVHAVRGVGLVLREEP